MGSLEGFDKRDHPVGRVIQRHLDRHNAACERRARAAPLRLQILAVLGFPRLWEAWQAREPLDKYYG